MIETIVVGAGHSGLAASWHLARHGIEHVVLEQGRVGESWRAQRWDSFALNTPNWAARMPGETDAAEPRDGFLTRDAWVSNLVAYARGHELPVRSGVRVTALEGSADRSGFMLRTDGPASGSLEARSVVVACGFQRVPRIPALAASLPIGVVSMHTADYRHPAQLPSGAVLVVGSGQSGGQIAEELLLTGRRVFVSASAVPRVPRRYRGRDIFEWLTEARFFDQTPDQVPDPRARLVAQPIISGVGRYGHTLSLQLLSSLGATLLGHLRAVDGQRLRFDGDLAGSIRLGDRASAEVRERIEQRIRASPVDVPPAEADPADEPVSDPEALGGPVELDLATAGIRSVIWATGFGADLSWIRLPVTDPTGAPIHEGGRSPVPGVWFVGIPWLRCRKSGLILGADEDGGAIAAQVAAHLAS